jgi:hypothetical protein
VPNLCCAPLQTAEHRGGGLSKLSEVNESDETVEMVRDEIQAGITRADERLGALACFNSADFEKQARLTDISRFVQSLPFAGRGDHSLLLHAEGSHNIRHSIL